MKLKANKSGIDVNFGYRQAFKVAFAVLVVQLGAILTVSGLLITALYWIGSSN